MTQNAESLHVHCRGARPDFRLVIAYLWGEDRDVDSDGDAEHPADVNWTELYLCDRSNPDVRIDVQPVRRAPLVLEIKASVPAFAARVALFLARETGGGVTLRDRIVSEGDLRGLVGPEFDVEAAIARAAQSKFRSATLEDPYPE